MLSGNCTEALSIQANVTISGSGAKLINNDIAPLPFPLPALLKQYWYIKRGERVRVRGHAPFYATLGYTCPERVKRREHDCLGIAEQSLVVLKLVELIGERPDLLHLVVDHLDVLRD